MIRLIRTNSENTDFVQLVRELDNYLKITDGEEHDFYNQFNHINVLKHIVIAYSNNKAVGCGAFKEFEDDTVEIKRMFIKPDYRKLQIGSKILNELEIWAKELAYKYCILETGTRQVEAVKFYNKSNYYSIPNYGQYQAMSNSLCFKKTISVK